MYSTVGTACQSAGVGVASSSWRVSPFLIPFSALLDWLALRSIYPCDPLPTQEMPDSRPCSSYTRTSPSIRVLWHQWGKRWKIKPKNSRFFRIFFYFFLFLKRQALTQWASEGSPRQSMMEKNRKTARCWFMTLSHVFPSFWLDQP